MRFVDKGNDRNIGFTESEVLRLSKNIYINPDNLFLIFLKRAGKRSNVLNTSFKDLQEYADFQDHFISVIKNDADASVYSSTSYCINCEADNYGNQIYYFVETVKPGDKHVFYYSKGRIPLNDYFKDDRDEEIGLRNTKQNFGSYLEYKTKQKFGETVWKRILRYIWAFFTFPVWLPIVIYLKMKSRFQK